MASSFGLLVPACIGLGEKYFVSLKEGRVGAYGELGDFDSTNPDATIPVLTGPAN